MKPGDLVEIISIPPRFINEAETHIPEFGHELLRLCVGAKIRVSRTYTNMVTGRKMIQYTIPYKHVLMVRHLPQSCVRKI